jgi:hypothetical protein
MDENEINGFSWSTLFIVTTVCCLLFTGAIYVLDGKIAPLLLWIAIASFVLSVLNRIWMYLKSPGKEEPESGYSYND